MNRDSFYTIIFIGLSATVLTGCGKKTDDTWYVVPGQENVGASEAPLPAATVPGTVAVDLDKSMAGQSLPEELVNTGDTPLWTLPEGWQRLPDRPMRAATLAAGEGDAAVELSVTSFPGDVGGLANNVNRWRRQLGLPPQDEETILGGVSVITANGLSLQLVELAHNGTAMRVAILPHEGNTWFFKMTGSEAAILAEQERFEAFVRTIRFDG